MVFPWSVPPPPPPAVDPALAGAPGAPVSADQDIPPWLLAAADQAPPADQPPPAPEPRAPWLPPPVADELAGAPAGLPPQAAPAAAPKDGGPPPVARQLAGGPGAPGNGPPPGALGTTTNDVPPPAPAPHNGPPGPARAGGEPGPQMYRGTGDEEQASIARGAELEARQQQALAEGQQRQADFERATLEDQRIQEMARRKDLAQREAQLEAERQAIASTPIDQSQWWNSKSEAQHGIAYIAAFCGGALSVYNGGKNDFTDFMQQQAAQNLEVQKANLANRKDMLEAGQNMYSRILQRYGDERVADQMFLAANFDALGHQAAAQAAQYNSPKALENGRMMQILAARAAAKATRDAAMADQELALRKRQVGIQAYEAQTGRGNLELQQKREGWDERKDVADLAYRYEALGLSHEEAMAKAQAERGGKGIEAEKWEAEKKARAIFMPNGKPLLDKEGNPVLMGNPELAAKQREQLDNTWAFRRELTEYLDIMDHAGNEFSGVPGLSATDAHARADQLYADMMLKTKNSAGTGALDQGMVKVFNQYVAPPKEWLNSSNPTASARQGLSSWKENTNNRYRMQYGYEGNFVDDWDSQVTPEKNAPVTSPWMQERRKRDEAIQEEVRNTTYPGPVGPPKPMGMLPTEKERPEELTRDRKPRATEESAGSRIDFVEKYMKEQPVTLRTQHGNVRVPRGSLTRDNAIAAGDGSFISVHDQPKTLPKGVKAIKWEDAANRDLDHAEDLWAAKQQQGKEGS